MREGWETKTLNELGTVARGKSRHRPRNAPELYGGKYPLIQTGDVQNARFYINSFSQTYNDIGLAQSKLWPKDTLCISIVGANTAATAILGFDACFPDSVIGFRANTNVSDVKFVKYSLELLRDHLKGISEGTARENLSLEKLLSVPIPTPLLEYQERIVSIISPYDDLIENNLRRIKLLEELAQRTYEEWYSKLTGKQTNIGSLIDYEIGGGWGNDQRDGEFTEEAFVIRGTDIDGLSKGDIDRVPFRYHTQSNLRSRKLQNGDLVFEVSGGSHTEGVAKTLLVTDALLRQFESDVMCASFCKLARPVAAEYSNYLFHYLRYLRKAKGTEVFEIRSASNIVNYNWTAFLRFQKIKVPEPFGLSEINKFCDPIHQQICGLGLQNRLLKESRDILLPRLMSGEVEV